MSPDVAAFCSRLYPELVGVLTAHCGQRPVAEEVAQEALAKVVVAWPKVQRMDHPEAWTYRVAFNLMRSRWRRARAERRALQRLGAGVPSGDGASASVDRLALVEALASLPERQRAAVSLRYLSDLSVAETAVALSCAQGTVKSLTSQAICRLRQRLRDPLDVPVAREGEGHG